MAIFGETFIIDLILRLVCQVQVARVCVWPDLKC